LGIAATIKVGVGTVDRMPPPWAPEPEGPGQQLRAKWRACVFFFGSGAVNQIQGFGRAMLSMDDVALASLGQLVSNYGCARALCGLPEPFSWAAFGACGF